MRRRGAAIATIRWCRSFLAGLRTVEASEKLGFVLKTGTSDMNVVGPVWQCPIVAYGPGDSSLDHTPNEHLPLDEYWKAVNVIEQTLMAFAHGRTKVRPYGLRHSHAHGFRAPPSTSPISACMAQTPPAAHGVRLHRWRRRARVDAAREHARVRGRDVPSAIGGGDAEVRSRRPPSSACRSICRSSSRRSAAAACSIRAVKKKRRALPARRARSIRCRRCPAARWKTSSTRPPATPGISCISSAAATSR